MAKSKKELDRESMFEKMLPALAENPFTVDKLAQSAEPVSDEPPAEDALSILQEKLFAKSGSAIGDMKNVSIVNIMEGLVLTHINPVIEKFNCCQCDRCRCDIVAYALNLLEPKYMVGELSEIEKAKEKIPEQQVVQALVKAVLKVRANPRH